MSDQVESILRDMILVSPPCEALQVYNDLTILTDNAHPSTLLSALDEYYASTFYVASNGILLTRFNKISEFIYANYNDGSLFKHDPLRLTCTEHQGSQQDLLDPDLNAAIVSYVKGFFSNGAGAAFQSDNGIMVCISNILPNPANFWNGRWFHLINRIGLQNIRGRTLEFLVTFKLMSIIMRMETSK